MTLVHSNFSRLAEVLDDLHIDAVDGMLFDLGVSSHSWMMQSVDFPICTTPRWICGWTARRV